MNRLSLLLILFSPILASACELKAGVVDFAPYSYQQPDGSWTGIDIDIFALLAKKSGCKIDVAQVTFDDGLRLLRDGKIDLMSQLSKLPERIDDMHFIGPIREEKISLLTTNAVKEDIRSLADINRLPYLFGKRKSSYIGEELKSRLRDDRAFASKFIEISSKLPRIDMVEKGRIVGFMIEQLNLSHMLKHSPRYQAMKVHPLEFSIGDVYLGLSKKTVNQERYQLLNRAFLLLRKQNAFTNLMAPYNDH